MFADLNHTLPKLRVFFTVPYCGGISNNRVLTSSGNIGKPGKSLKKSSMQGKIMEFENPLNNHGKIMEFCEII